MEFNLTLLNFTQDLCFSVHQSIRVQTLQFNCNSTTTNQTGGLWPEVCLFVFQ